MEEIIDLAIIAQKKGDNIKAENLYREVLKEQSDNLTANHNLGVLLYSIGRIEDSVISFKKTIQLSPNFPDVYNNIGVALSDLDKFEEAEKSYKKALEIKPNYPEVYYNRGNTLKKLGRVDEAEKLFKKAIVLKPDYAEVYCNLGILQLDFNKRDDAIKNFYKCLELEPNHFEAFNNLDIALKQKEVLLKIKEAKESIINYKINLIKKIRNKLFGSDLRLDSNPFLSYRAPEEELINCLYKIKYKNLDNTNNVFYGNGKHSNNFSFFENNYSIVKNVKNDLTEIMKQAVKSDIFIIDSFFNILSNGGGSYSHSHIASFDNKYKLVGQKYSLTYYLSIGDQNSSDPGILKLENPTKEILPSKGMIMTFPANRKHSAFYNGSKDRVMIGVNFYSLI